VLNVTGITKGEGGMRCVLALAKMASLPLRRRIRNEGNPTVSSEHDIGPAKATYHGFVGLLKWGTIASIVVAVIVILLIAS
jgi:hypothetical protein